MAFLYRIMGSHPDASESENANAEQLVSYLQRVFGCAATGKPEKLLFVLYGEGNNGKTTLLEIIRDALGDKEYAGQVQVDSLMIRPKGGALEQCGQHGPGGSPGLPIRFVERGGTGTAAVAEPSEIPNWPWAD